KRPAHPTPVAGQERGSLLTGCHVKKLEDLELAARRQFGMVQPRSRLGLVVEALQLAGVQRASKGEHLERQAAAQRLLAHGAIPSGGPSYGYSLLPQIRNACKWGRAGSTPP